MTVETTTITDETHELEWDQKPTLFDWADLLFKAVIAASAFVIAARL